MTSSVSTSSAVSTQKFTDQPDAVATIVPPTSSSLQSTAAPTYQMLQPQNPSNVKLKPLPLRASSMLPGSVSSSNAVVNAAASSAAAGLQSSGAPSLIRVYKKLSQAGSSDRRNSQQAAATSNADSSSAVQQLVTKRASPVNVSASVPQQSAAVINSNLSSSLPANAPQSSSVASQTESAQPLVVLSSNADPSSLAGLQTSTQKRSSPVNANAAMLNVPALRPNLSISITSQPLRLSSAMEAGGSPTASDGQSTHRSGTPRRKESHSRNFSLEDAEKTFSLISIEHRKKNAPATFLNCNPQDLDISKIDEEDFQKTLKTVLQAGNINADTKPLSPRTCAKIKEYQKADESWGYKLAADIFMGFSAFATVPLDVLQNSDDEDYQLGGYIATGVTAFVVFIMCKILGDRSAANARAAPANLRVLFSQKKHDFQAMGQEIINWWGFATCLKGLSHVYAPEVLEQVGISADMQTKRQFLKEVLLTNVFIHMCIYFGIDLEKEYEDAILPDDVIKAWREIKSKMAPEIWNHFELGLLELKIPKEDVEEMLSFPRDALRAIFDEVKKIKHGSRFKPPKPNKMKESLRNFRQDWENWIEGSLEDLAKQEHRDSSIRGSAIGHFRNMSADVNLYEGENSSPRPLPPLNKGARDSMVSVASDIYRVQPKPESKARAADSSTSAAPTVQPTLGISLKVPKHMRRAPSIDERNFGTLSGINFRTLAQPRVPTKAQMFFDKVFTPPSPGKQDRKSPRGSASSDPRASLSLSLASSVPQRNTGPRDSLISNVQEHPKRSDELAPASNVRTGSSDDDKPDSARSGGWDISPVQSPKAPKLPAKKSADELPVFKAESSANPRAPSPQIASSHPHHHHQPNARPGSARPPVRPSSAKSTQPVEEQASAPTTSHATAPLSLEPTKLVLTRSDGTVQAVPEL